MTGFVLAAGGTGGHLFPAQALAAELVGCGAKVELVSDARANAFGRSVGGFELHTVSSGNPGGNARLAVRSFGQLAFGVVQARRLLRRMRPAAVIGFGGYPSLPTMLAAVWLGLPTMIHEQNAVLGRANRLLAPFTHKIATGFPETARLRRIRAGLVHTGNPVRPAILEASRIAYQTPQADGDVDILVLGGSQGAHIFAEIVPAALAELDPALRRRLRISQQARPEDRAALIAAYAEAGIAAEIETFFTDVPQRLARTQLVICRAGASTIAELAAVGRPALLVPYPHAADDHQSVNARCFAAAGGGKVIAQPDFRPEALAAELAGLLADAPQLELMARRAAAFARRDAARQLASLAQSLAAGSALRECAA
jgi:UDP-N-acetylglucosamine--N-acetylmuramyl-(pentapeptide) pyrophosphoryl-undecaprenol N-acetylglucosamine transferase